MINTNFDRELQQKIDLKTKPINSLGLLEQIAFKIAKAQNTLTPQLKKPTILIYAADHGLAEENVSAYPQEVTHQMVSNFLAEGAAINVFCKENKIDFKVIDAGVNAEVPSHPKLIQSKAGYGTNNILKSKAMTRKQLDYCFGHGATHMQKLNKEGCNIIGFGEMGIGNSSITALLLSNLLQLPLEKCILKGTMKNQECFAQKQKTLLALQHKYPEKLQPLELLETFGGFEIAQMTGAMLEAYKQNMIILIDGYTCCSAIILASKIEPNIIKNTLFCHESEEQVHQLILRSLGERGILKMNLKLGEGSSCALAYPIIKNAVNFLNHMATFESANISKAIC